MLPTAPHLHAEPIDDTPATKVGSSVIHLINKPPYGKNLACGVSN